MVGEGKGEKVGMGVVGPTMGLLVGVREGRRDVVGKEESRFLGRRVGNWEGCRVVLGRLVGKPVGDFEGGGKRLGNLVLLRLRRRPSTSRSAVRSTKNRSNQNNIWSFIMNKI